MSHVEYVARVVIERVERTTVPGVVAGTSRRTTTDTVTVKRDKAEVAAFTLRVPTVHQIRGMVRDVMAAALVDNVKGEPGETGTDDDEEDEEF